MSINYRMTETHFGEGHSIINYTNLHFVHVSVMFQQTAVKTQCWTIVQLRARMYLLTSLVSALV